MHGKKEKKCPPLTNKREIISLIQNKKIQIKTTKDPLLKNLSKARIKHFDNILYQ